MKVKLAFIDKFESEFNNKKYNIYTFVNPVTFQTINGVDLQFDGKIIPYELYTCYIELVGKGKFAKWRVTKIES